MCFFAKKKIVNGLSKANHLFVYPIIYISKLSGLLSYYSNLTVQFFSSR